MDASGIERVGWPAFSQLFAYVRERLAEWRTRIVRQAVVLPEGPTGALLAGMVARLGMPYPMRFFESESDALAWLAWPSVAAVAEASELAAAGRGLTRTVHRLRAWLEVALDDVTLGSAAAALGVAPRTLQRELKAAHTSFIAETHAARVRRAARMLEHTDDKVDAIARAVGCASASRLSALFRQRLGLTPARYRERQRK
jgi:transcriptional regulator GlxA family with amidase domain